CRPSVNTIGEIERGTIMNWNWALAGAITTLAMGPWISMAGERPVFRAQGGYPAPGYHEGVVFEDCEECDDDHCGPFGRCWNYITTLGGRPGDSYSRGGYGAGGYGQTDYRYLYRYRAPQNLVYPAANQPAGVVVYPYYTV